MIGKTFLMDTLQGPKSITILFALNALCTIRVIEMNTWIFDIDGTLANGSHRKHLLEQKPRKWTEWEKLLHLDEPHHDILFFLNLGKAIGMSIVICTGRGEETRERTEQWLANHGIEYDKMYMRPAKDYRDDSVIKKEALDKMREEGYNPIVAFDDRDRVVKMWRENGIRCLQVAEGNF